MKPRYLCAAVLLLSLSLSAVADQPRYTLTQIGPVPVNGIGITFVTGLNEKGEIVGTIVGVDAMHPFFWRSGELTLLEGNVGGITAALNDRSQVATTIVNPTNGIEEAVLWQRGQFSPLGSPSATIVFTPVDITNSGRVLGTTFDPVPSTTDAYLRERSGDFGLLEPLDDAFAMRPRRINNRGIAVGFSESLVGDRVLVQSVLWRDGAVQRLNMPPGTNFDVASDINERGQIVGEAAIGDEISGFVWHKGKVTTLPVIDPALDAGTSAQGINNRGWIVGITFGPVRDAVATLWRNGIAYDLHTLISPDDPLKPFVRLQHASFINDSGLIIANGLDSRTIDGGAGSPYLLTPTRH
jgi:uncharacterized membrane protein